jgi:hypothetical protein
VERINLTPDELQDVTGRKQPTRQIKWLSENGWQFHVGGDGLPKVDREYYRERVGVKREKARRGPRLEGLARGQA